jgi:undecaprenyl-diphosphatase
MSLLEAIILGIVQGLTEFLPVSSSGHIELTKAIFNTQVEEDLLFTVLLHAATALSTILVFRKDIMALFKGLFQFKWNDETKYCLFILISMIPAAIVGLFFEHKIEALFDSNILLVGLMLLLTGLILLWSDRAPKEQDAPLSNKKATIMGIVQAIAILPGISRSGSTIATGLLLGMNRSKAARFSFIMVLPLILGAALKKVLDFQEAVNESITTEYMPLLAGFIAAFLAGLVAINWMIKLVENSALKWFAYYCFAVGGLSIGYHLLS